MKPRGLLGLIAFSERRSDILLLLQEKPRTLSEIKDHFNVKSPEIHPQLKKLEEANLICKEGNKYILTEIGEIVSTSFDRFAKTLKVFENGREFWKEHEIGGIPEEFRLRLYELLNSKVVRSTPTDVFEPHRDFMNNLLKSKRIKGVSPIFHPEYPKFFLELAKRGSDISLIVTRDVYSRIIKEHKQELEGFLKHCRFLVCDEKVQVAFTVTDTFLSVGLFLKGGSYDTQQDLVSFEESALKWGDDLFRYYEKRSGKVEL